MMANGVVRIEARGARIRWGSGRYIGGFQQPCPPPPPPAVAPPYPSTCAQSRGFCKMRILTQSTSEAVKINCAGWLMFESPASRALHSTGLRLGQQTK